MSRVVSNIRQIITYPRGRTKRPNGRSPRLLALQIRPQKKTEQSVNLKVICPGRLSSDRKKMLSVRKLARRILLSPSRPVGVPSPN